MLCPSLRGRAEPKSPTIHTTIFSQKISRIRSLEGEGDPRRGRERNFFGKSGWGGAIVVEQSDAIKTYLVRWKSVRSDICEVAKLCFIEKLKIREICVRTGKSRTTNRQSIRTLLKYGVSQLNLSDCEKKLIQMEISRKIQSNKILKEKYGAN